MLVAAFFSAAFFVGGTCFAGSVFLRLWAEAELGDVVLLDDEDPDDELLPELLLLLLLPELEDELLSELLSLARAVGSAFGAFEGPSSLRDLSLSSSSFCRRFASASLLVPPSVSATTLSVDVVVGSGFDGFFLVDAALLLLLLLPLLVLLLEEESDELDDISVLSRDGVFLLMGDDFGVVFGDAIM